MKSLITVGYSSRKHNPEFIDYLKKSSGFKKLEVIEKINNGEKSLNQVYNEILDESETDIVVLCHDDLYFDTNSWYHKIINHFEKTDYGILGVAGTTYMSKSGQWWEQRKKMHGIVNHEHEGKKWESKYSPSLGNDIKEVVVVDGLFLAIKKSNIKKKFDETVPGFHFYDVEFSFQNYLEKVKIGVIYNVRVTHKSIGMTNEQWELNRQTFEKKYSNLLPTFIEKKVGDKLKCLYIPSQEESDFEKTKKELEFLSKQNFEIEVLLDEQKPIKKLYDNIKFKKFLLSNPPGYKIGDGKWQIQNMGTLEISKPGIPYMMFDPNYDFVVLNSKENYKQILKLYSSYPKCVGFDLDIKKNHESIKLSNFSLMNLSLTDFYSLSNSSLYTNKNKVKIVSGHSEKGGSTTAFIRLTNSLNDYGIDTTFYGPHDWHIDKCKSADIKDLKFEKDDTLIVHFLNLQQRPNVSKVILSIHEKNLFEISKMTPFWDKVIFLNEKHKQYHDGFKGDFEIIPNITEELNSNEKNKLDKIAGVIGTIDFNKQTHVSIQRALSDGCTKVYIFGSISQPDYFDKFVNPLLSDDVIYYGHLEDKQMMYDMIGRVYLSSLSEVAPLVKNECESTGTKFFGNQATEHDQEKLTNEEIVKKWLKVIQK